MKSPFSSAFFALLARKLETRTGEVRERVRVVTVIVMKLTGHMSEPGEELNSPVGTNFKL